MMMTTTNTNTAYDNNQNIQMPTGTKLSASEFSKLVRPNANYFGAGLNNLTSYLDE